MLENIVTHASGKKHGVPIRFSTNTIQYILLTDKTGIHLNPDLVAMAG